VRVFLIAFAIVATLALGGAANPAHAQGLDVTRTTLANGLQVVVVHDPLAPVVTTMLNYKAGSNEQEYDGQAHALEHMMFRGSNTLSESQLADISELLGGDNDADTEAEVTQFYFTAPSQYLDLLLRMEASRAQGLTLAPSAWNIEKDAITQEVTQDNSNPLYRLFEKVENALFAGTPYAKNGLGTVDGFQHVINSEKLRQFYDAWYHPNNAVLVIAGDVDNATAVKEVNQYFGGVPAAKLPARPVVQLQPVKSQTFSTDSDQPYTIVAMAFRFPGWSERDYAAAQVLESVLDNQRANLYGLVASGKLLYAGIQDVDSHALASGAGVFGVIPISQKPDVAIQALRGVLAGYKKNGVPADLVDVAKRRAIADAEFKANSIEGLASTWSDAVAVRGESSPDELLNAVKAVTPADVDRVLAKYVDFNHAIIATAIPKNLGKISSSPPPPLAQENNKVTVLHHDPLPEWALEAFRNVQVPKQTITPVDVTLANGMRLIVVPEHVSHTVVVQGAIQSNEAMQASKDVQGVADITEQLMPFGTTTYDRLALRKALDDVAVDVDTGTEFSLTALSDQFDRGVQLLADAELHPAFPSTGFQTVKQQEVQELQGEMTSPDHLLEVALNQRLYPANDPLQIFATPDTANNVSLDTVKKWFTDAYRPDMTTVVVVGDVTADQVKATFQKYFGGWTATGPKPDVFLPAVPNNSPSNAEVPATGRVQSQVSLVQTNALTRASDDWASMAVANAALGSSASSILFHDVRDQHGLVYGIYSRLETHKNRGTFSIDFASDPQKIDPAQSLALADLRRLSQSGVDSDDLARGKTMLVSQIPLKQQSFDGIGTQLIDYTQLGLPLDQATIDAQREVGATNDDIIAAVRRWIRPDGFVRVILGPAPK